MISIFFYFTSESKKVQQSINSILKQSSNQFELFIVDGSDKATNLTIDTSLFSKIKFFKTNLENNIAYFANRFLTQSTGKYVYFMGQDTELESNFVKICNSIHSEDFAIFSNKAKTLETITKNKDLVNTFFPCLEDKVFSISFLKNNSINFPLNIFNTLSFLYKVLTKFNSCKIVPQSVKIQILPSSIYSDLYFTGEIVTSFLHDYKQSYF
jgi:glycosyltransferase involved in cell wall biosynthesis